MSSSKKITMFFVTIVTLFSWTALGHAAYTITDIGTLGGVNCFAQGINDAGQVVGQSNATAGSLHAFLWDPITGYKDLTSLGTGNNAFAINNLGQVVGNNGSTSAYIWDSTNGKTLLGTLYGNTYVRAVNDTGQVAGYSNNNTSYRAVLWTPSTGMVDLGTPSGASYGYGINNSGTVVGMASAKAYVKTTSGSVQILTNTLGGTTSQARGINDAGQVVGYATNSAGNEHAFLWTSVSGMQDLGTLGGTKSYAYGINNSGQILGASYTADNSLHVFVYSGGVMTDLSQALASYGWTDLVNSPATTIMDINNKGQIVGSGHINGALHGYVINAPVPLPPAFYMFGSGLLGLVGARRKFFRG